MSDDRNSRWADRSANHRVKDNRPSDLARGRTSGSGSRSLPRNHSYQDGHEDGYNERAGDPRRERTPQQGRWDTARENERGPSSRDRHEGGHEHGHGRDGKFGPHVQLPLRTPHDINGREDVGWSEDEARRARPTRARQSWDDAEDRYGDDRASSRDAEDGHAGLRGRPQRPSRSVDRWDERDERGSGARDEWESARTWDSWDDDELGHMGHDSGGARHGKRARRPGDGRYSREDEQWDGRADDRYNRDGWYDQDGLDADWPQDGDWQRRAEQAPRARVGTIWRPDVAGVLTDWKETTQHWTTAQKQRFLSTRRGRITGLVLLICMLAGMLGGIPTTVFAAAQYHQLSDRVHDSMSHLKNAEADAKVLSKTPFDTKTIAALRGELVAAHNDFSQAQSQLQALPGMLQAIPIAGSKLAGAGRLVPIALEGTQAGITACDALTILATSLKNPLDPKAQGLTSAGAAQLAQDADEIAATFNTIVQQVNALQPSDLTLDSRLGPAITGFKAQLPKIEQLVQGAQAVAHLAPTLLGVGTPTNYLVEVLDSTELRPGGGFIGNYGILTLAGGRLSSLHIQDVDLLDTGVKYQSLNIPLPSQYSWFASLFPRWGFRDSNLDADFPTSAQNGEKLYATEMKDTGQKPVPVQGVIAITPWLIQNAMKITGPIYVPEYKETVTPDNLVDKIHYYALGTYTGSDTTYDPSSGSSLRKRFTGYLFQAFMAKVKQDMSGNFSKFAQLFTDSLHSKDVQIYLNPKPAETFLQQLGMASAIQAPTAGDSLFEVDANISGSKANYFLTYAMADQITIDQSGTATHHLAITYTWPPNPQSLILDYAAGINNRYHAFSRVYIPPSAVLGKESGWDSPGSTTAFGRKEWSGVTYVYYGKTMTVTLTWKVPNAATHDASGWHYRLLFQKQAGITWQTNVQVSLPSCAAITGTPQGFTSIGGHSVSVKEPLANDVQFAVDYTVC